jgi:hypothetical protein
MDLKIPNGQKYPEKRVFDNRKKVLNVFVGKPTDFKSPPMATQRLRPLQLPPEGRGCARNPVRDYEG